MKLLLSRFIDENNRIFFDSIKEKNENGEQIYIIVPEQFSLGTEIEVFKRLNIESTFNIKVKSFKTIVEEILHFTVGKGINFISEQAKFLIIQSILLEIKDELRVFQENIYDKEFIDLLINFISDINDNGLGIESFFEFFANYEKNLSAELGKKLNDIKLIFAKYISTIAESEYSLKEKIDYAIENIDKINYFKNINFYLYRFYDISKKEMELLKKIDKISKSTVLNLTLDSKIISNMDNRYSLTDADIFDMSKKFYDKLKTNIDKIEEKHIEKSGEFSNIEKLINNIFRYDINKLEKEFEYEKIENIKIVRNNNTSKEIENLAISIQKDIINSNLNENEKSNKFKYKDIAVLVTNPDEYYGKIKKNFELNNIPFFIDERRSTLDNSMIKFLKSGVSLLKNGLNTDYIVQFLKSSFLNIDIDSINLFENYLNQKNFRGNMVLEDKYYKISQNTRYEDEDKENLEKIKNIKDEFTSLLFIENKNILELIHNENNQNFQTLTKIMYNFFSNEKILQDYILYESKISEEEKKENREVWKNFIDLIDNLYLMRQNHNSEIDYVRFFEIVLSSIDNFKIGIVPPNQDSIIIGDLKRSRFNKVKKLYVIGMSNLYYPHANNDTDIFSEDEKSNLIDLGFEIRKTSAQITANDKLSFYELLNTAESEIVFSYSLVNNSNEAMDKAYILKSVEKIIMVSNIIENDKKDKFYYKDYIYSNTKLNEYLPIIRRNILQNKEINKEEIKFFNSIINQLEKNKKFGMIKNSLDIQSKDKTHKKISKELAKKIYNPTKFSVSQLEAFNANPYSHFIQYGIKPRDDDNYELSILDRGNLIHDYMKNFIERKFKNKEEVDSEEIFKETIENLLDESKRDADKNKFYLKNMGKNSEIYSKIIANQLENTKIDDIDLEIRYGENSKYKSVKIKLDNGKFINIEGKIDRVDKISIEENNYYRVIDYKTGSKEIDLAKIFEGFDLQLLLYLQAVVESDEKGKPLGAFYQKLNQEYILIDENDIEELYSEGLFDDIKLHGFINSDENIFLSIEKDIDSKDANTSILYDFNGRGKSFDKKQNTISEKDFIKLFRINVKNIKLAIEKILNGNIELSPYNLNGKTPYVYDKFKTIGKEEGLKYRYIKNINWSDLQMKLDSINEEDDDE